jgi:hypothetical protein
MGMKNGVNVAVTDGRPVFTVSSGAESVAWNATVGGAGEAARAPVVGASGRGAAAPAASPLAPQAPVSRRARALTRPMPLYRRTNYFLH